MMILRFFINLLIVSHALRTLWSDVVSRSLPISSTTTTTSIVNGVLTVVPV